jgi:hypothetical protein
MTYPIAAAHGDEEAAGASYAGLFVRAELDSVLDQLVGRRFSGWVGPQQEAWVLAVARTSTGPVAGEGRPVEVLTAEVAEALATVAFAVRVLRDEVLYLSGWHATEHLGDYVSDPSIESKASTQDDDVAGLEGHGGLEGFGRLDAFPEPQGAWYAPAFATACGRPDGAEELGELLGETLDHDSVFESERLAQALRLLGLPGWLVSAPSLPGDVPGGPNRTELVQLGAGHGGLGGRIGGLVTGIVRRRRTGPRR